MHFFPTPYYIPFFPPCKFAGKLSFTEFIQLIYE